MTNAFEEKPFNKKERPSSSLSYYNVSFSSPTKHVVRDKKTSKIFIVKIDPRPHKAGKDRLFRSNSAPPNIPNMPPPAPCGPQCIPASLSKRDVSRISLVRKKLSNKKVNDVRRENPQLRIHVGKKENRLPPHPPTTTPENSDNEDNGCEQESSKHLSQSKGFAIHEFQVKRHTRKTKGYPCHDSQLVATAAGYTNGEVSYHLKSSTKPKFLRATDKAKLYSRVGLKRTPRGVPAASSSSMCLRTTSYSQLAQTPIDYQFAKDKVKKKAGSYSPSYSGVVKKCTVFVPEHGQCCSFGCHEYKQTEQLPSSCISFSKDAWEAKSYEKIVKEPSVLECNAIGLSDDDKSLLPQYQQKISKDMHVNDILVGLRQMPQREDLQVQQKDEKRPISNYRMRLISQAAKTLMRNVQLVDPENEKPSNNDTRRTSVKAKKVKFKFTDSKHDLVNETKVSSGNAYEEIPSYSNADRRKTIQILAVKPPIREHTLTTKIKNYRSAYQYQTITLADGR